MFLRKSEDSTERHQENFLIRKFSVELILRWGRRWSKQYPKVPPFIGSSVSVRFLTSHFNTVKQVWKCLSESATF